MIMFSAVVDSIGRSIFPGVLFIKELRWSTSAKYSLLTKIWRARPHGREQGWVAYYTEREAGMAMKAFADVGGKAYDAGKNDTILYSENHVWAKDSRGILCAACDENGELLFRTETVARATMVWYMESSTQGITVVDEE